MSSFLKDNPTSPFSKPTLHCLKNAGWYPGRRINFKGYRKFLEKNDNPIHHSVEKFLSCYGKLVIRHPNHTWKREVDSFWLDPIIADETFFLDGGGLDDYNELTQSALCAIGTACENHILLLMNEQGIVFGTDGGSIYLIGDSGEQAIENLCCGTMPGLIINILPEKTP